MTTARKPSGSSRGGAPTNRRTLVIVVGALVVLVLIAVIVALASGGDDSADVGSDSTVPSADGDATDATTAVTDNPARIPSGDTAQVSFAEIAGDPLPRFDPAAAVDPAIGQSAPSLTAAYFDNTEVTIEFDDGNPRVLVFLAHWCPHCQAEVPRLTEWMAVNGVPTDIEIVAVSTAVDSGAPNYPPSEWLVREGWPVTALRDSQEGALASAFGLSGFPFIVVVNGDGTVAARNSGELTVLQWEALLATAA